MLEELCTEIVIWESEKDRIILLIDVNEDVGNPYMTAQLGNIGLKEATLDRHNQSWDRQATYHRGQDPIDGIFVSANLQFQDSGYLPFSETPSDHRGIWVKVKEEDVFWLFYGKVGTPRQ